MAGGVVEDHGTGGSSSSCIEGMLNEQRCHSSDSLTEWRSCKQVEGDTPSTLPPYWDTDDDGRPKPADLYGKLTWKIESFSQTTKRELKSNEFEVGGYKCDLEVDYGSNENAVIVYRALNVDKELQPDKVRREMSISDGKLLVHFEAIEARFLRASYSAFVDLIILATQIIEEYSTSNEDS